MHKQDPAQSRDDKPSRKKPMFPVSEGLRTYLKERGREVYLPVSYQDLLGFTWSTPLKDKNGKDSGWEKTSYDSDVWSRIREGLLHIYAILKTEGDLSFLDHLEVARIDYCCFGNSNPFRIRIVNTFNDNYDHYYIKVADASRIYGLELEHSLSPNRMTFFTAGNTLVEEHIPGIPGDIFINQMMDRPEVNKIRLAKEFVKFNERCYLRLLGDMRSYNFVVNVMPDIEDYQYRIRAIDFDQQSYEGKRNLYLPQFFKENQSLVQLCLTHLNKASISQYQAEERTQMSLRYNAAKKRISQLLDIMDKDHLAPVEKMQQLRQELLEATSQQAYSICQSMGSLVSAHLKLQVVGNPQ